MFKLTSILKGDFNDCDLVLTIILSKTFEVVCVLIPIALYISSHFKELFKRLTRAL